MRPGRLILQTFTFEGMPDAVALEKLTLEDLGDGRTRLSTTSLVDSFEERDAFVSSGMEEGIRESYERLDELLAEAPYGHWPVTDRSDRPLTAVSQADGP